MERLNWRRMSCDVCQRMFLGKCIRWQTSRVVFMHVLYLGYVHMSVCTCDLFVESAVVEWLASGISKQGSIPSRVNSVMVECPWARHIFYPSSGLFTQGSWIIIFNCALNDLSCRCAIKQYTFICDLCMRVRFLQCISPIQTAII